MPWAPKMAHMVVVVEEEEDAGVRRGLTRADLQSKRDKDDSISFRKNNGRFRPKAAQLCRKFGGSASTIVLHRTHSPVPSVPHCESEELHKELYLGQSEQPSRPGRTDCDSCSSRQSQCLSRH